MNANIKRAFLFVAVFQFLHSVEEYVFELWEHLAPARFLSGLVSDDLPFGFAVINIAIVMLISFSYIVPVRNASPNARRVVWFWAMLETFNGAGHLWLGFSGTAYFPGLYTAPFLLLFGVVLMQQLITSRNAA